MEIHDVKIKFKWVSFWVFATILGFSVFVIPLNKADAITCPNGGNGVIGELVYSGVNAGKCAVVGLDNITTFVSPVETAAPSTSQPSPEANVCTSSNGTWSATGCTCPSPRVPSTTPDGYITCISETAAQAITQNDPTGGCGNGRHLESTSDGDVCVYDSQTAATVSAAAGVAPNQTNPNTPSTDPAKKCTSWTDSLTSPIDCGLIPSLANMLLYVVSRLLWLSGILLNGAANITLNLNSYTQSFAIDKAWMTIRDMMNIVFIFALLWISIQQILGLTEAKKFLASIIISALLINFSLFFTKVVVDISNIIALQFYSGITNGEFLGPNASWDGGISNQFMGRLKLQSVYASGSTATGGGASAQQPGSAGSDFSGTNLTTVFIMSTIFILITSFVFLTVGLMLMARTAVLIILMVTSPIGFIGGLFPKLETYTKKWRDELTNQALFAPIFFMMIWMVLKITENVQTTGASGTNTASFASALGGNNSSSVSIIFNYLVLISFILAALKVAKDTSGAAGASFAKFGGTALGSIAGGAGGAIFRNTAGRLASLAIKNEKWKNKASEIGADGKPTFAARASMLALRSTEGVAKSSGDVRGMLNKAPGVSGVLKAAGADVDFGKASGAGGFKKSNDEFIKDQIKKQEASAKLLEVSKEEERRMDAEKKAQKTKYDAEKKKHDDEEVARIEANKKAAGHAQTLARMGGDEEAFRREYDNTNGRKAGDYDHEFKAVAFEKEFKEPESVKQINEARKKQFTQQLGTPGTIGNTNIIYSRPFTIGARAEGNLQAFEKMTKPDKDEKALLEAKADLKEVLKELINTTEDSSENIKLAIEKADERRAAAEAKFRSIPPGSGHDEERAKASATLVKEQRISRKIDKLGEKIENLEDKIKRNKDSGKDGGKKEKGDDKKDKDEEK